MARVDDYLRKQAAELLQALNEGCYKEDNIPCQIEEGLFLGSFGAANNEEELTRLNITHILTVGSAMPPAYPNDFVYKHFDECFDYIEEAKRSGGSVLVHCFVGRSRSVAVVIPYLLKKHGMTLFEALDHVKSGRAWAAPNAGFSTQLYEYEMFLSGKSLSPKWLLLKN
ncbi:putative phosphoric monoester hydrolase [Rosa chinensis]|uniref:protein-tyrosine-phosphatase n=1 Tax=Rosa chinensis TaxID=74649 RepID=A0A2P6QX97_ROSCH|nr:putative phosphoric monoester hydrolase [Rosa chinensis]